MIQENFSLQQYNTFGVAVFAHFFVEVKNTDQLETVLDWYGSQKKMPLLILGAGSNVLFTKDFQGLVLKLSLNGREVIEERGNNVLVQAAAGENWHDFVSWTVKKGWGGLENLSLIPGNVGTAPMQNIGAYGVEQERFFMGLKALDIKRREVRIFTKSDCSFGYRNSIFKQQEKGNWMILSVAYVLQKKPVLHLEYGAIKAVLSDKKIKIPNIKDVADAVISIRQSKLPDPQKIGNAGSFFKNPVVEKGVLQYIQKSCPEVPFFSSQEGHKIPAGWLIEQAGWKGKRVGNCGVHKDQALVLVNYGGATGEEILKLSQKIQRSVKEKFSILLGTEVNIV